MCLKGQGVKGGGVCQKKVGVKLTNDLSYYNSVNYYYGGP